MRESEANDKIDEFNNEHGFNRDRDVLLVARLRSAGLSAVQIAEVLAAIEETCHECWDGDRTCRCWDDS